MSPSRLIAIVMCAALLTALALIALTGGAWSRVEQSRHVLDRAVETERDADRLATAVHAWLLLGDRSRISDPVLREGGASHLRIATGMMDRLAEAAPDSVASGGLQQLRERIQFLAAATPDNRTWRTQSPLVISQLEAVSNRIEARLQAAAASTASDLRSLRRTAVYGVAGYTLLLIGLWLWIRRRLPSMAKGGDEADVASRIDAQVQIRTADLIRQNSALKAAETRVSARLKTLEAETASRLELLANLGHDIRTPLNGILGIAELMLQDAPHERDRQRMQTIMGSGRMLLRVVDGVLNSPSGATAAEAVSPAVDPQRTERLSASVLLAEDNAVNQIVIREMLEHLGCRVDLAENGRIAVERSAVKTYDLILMDWQMPELDGIQATQQIRARERDSGRVHLPIVALTANVSDHDAESCRQAGMDDFVAKPASIEALRGAVERALDLRGEAA